MRAKRAPKTVGKLVVLLLLNIFMIAIAGYVFIIFMALTDQMTGGCKAYNCTTYGRFDKLFIWVGVPLALGLFTTWLLINRRILKHYFPNTSVK